MAEDINTEILKESEYTVKIAKKELGKTLDYSVNSLKDLDLLIEYVKNHFSNLKNEGKLSDQTIQRASVSIGCYLGEVIRRAYGGTWTAKNKILKTLEISGKEVSPIRYIFDRLTKDSDYSLEKYWSDTIQLIKPKEKIEDSLSIPAVSKKKSNQPTIIGISLAGLAVLCFIGLLGIKIYSNVTTIPPTITPRPTATRIPTKPPTKVPTPTKIPYTPTPTEDSSCKSSDVRSYVKVTSELLMEIHSENQSMEIVGITNVLTSPTASTDMANLTQEHYNFATTIKTPICLQTAHKHLLELLRSRYNMFASAVKGDYASAIDWSSKSDLELSLWDTAVKKVTNAIE